MDEKHPRPMSPIRPTTRRTRPAIISILLITALLYCFHHLQSLSRPATDRTTTPTKQDVTIPLPKFDILLKDNAPVPLEAHIMSKCPDARDCLRDLVLPAMQRAHNKVNFTLSFIGRPTDNDGVACKHGPAECLGNIIELCAQELYPDPKTFLGFTMCLTKSYRRIPQRDLVEDCALEHAIDFNKLNECATKDDGAFGVGMLRSSVRRSSEAGVTKSCTVRLDDQVYCIRDDGKWKDCPSGAGVNDLVIAIEKLYRSS